MRTKNRTLGQSIIEFALIFPFLLFLLLGLFDLGRAVLFMSTLNTAAREGTRWAIVQNRDYSKNALCKVKDTSGNDLILTANECVCNYVRTQKLFTLQALVGGIDPDDPATYCAAPSGALITPDIYYPTDSTDPEANVTITITYNYLPITPGMKELLGSGIGIPLKAESKMLLAPVAR